VHEDARTTARAARASFDVMGRWFTAEDVAAR
jgi:hypothetical protein